MDTLFVGCIGPYVEMLQLALLRSGFPVDIDGIFGYNTRNSLIEFQRRSGITPDGIAGPVTWGYLKPFLTGYVEKTINPNDTLHNLAIRYRTTIDAIETANPTLNALNLPVGRRIVIPLNFPVVPTNINYSYELTALCIEGLSNRYPFLRTGVAGYSIMNHFLLYINIGTGNNQVFYNASHHANEWITTPLLLKFLENYCNAYAIGGEINGNPARGLYSTTSLFMIPLVNPDGVDLVTGALSPQSNYYKSAASIAASFPSVPFPSGWKANIVGTDLNLNYPAGWENAREIKFAEGFTRPAPRDYVGTSPLSAPESSAVYRFTRSYDFSLTLSYHTQGEVIYWKYLDFNPPRSYEIALRFGAVSGYDVAETPYSSGFAGYKDWFIQDYNRPGYTIEAGLGENPLPISQFDKIYADNIGILTEAMTATL